jgi:hypothetical protein
MVGHVTARQRERSGGFALPALAARLSAGRPGRRVPGDLSPCGPAVASRIVTHLMAAATPALQISGRTRWRLRHADANFYLAVAVLYVAATLIAIAIDQLGPDYLMYVAERALGGHLDSDALKGGVDSVYFDGRYYMALGPAQLAAYLPLAAISPLQGVGRYVAPLLFGIPAAWAALPLARRYGATDGREYWIATFVAFGSLLFFASTVGDSYYLAHSESFLALMAFLLEWRGRRRPWVLGAALGFSFLARATTLAAALPFGLMILWRRRRDARAVVAAAVAFGAPVALAGALFCWYNWLRFGSLLETGYGISYLVEPALVADRSAGIFSLVHVPENLRLFLVAPPNLAGFWPVASRWGMSMFLVSPALLLSAKAGLGGVETRLLWVAALLVAVPVFLYYGGGFVQYGFRYSLDFTPFLVALMAIGCRHDIGRVGKTLIAASVVSVSYGVLLDVVWHHYT